jgi:DNA repair protein RadD
VDLRPYQREAVDAVFRWVTQHDGNPLVVIPTGGGKSLIMGTLVSEALGNAPGARALILAHRKELLEQNARAVATAMPLGSIGIYSAGLRKRDTTSSVIVAGIQSAASDPYRLGAFDLVLVDEAHLVPTDHDTLYRKTIDALRMMNPHVRFVGLTATPYRLKVGLLHRGPNPLFTDVAYEAETADLIRDGYLCPLISRATLLRLNVDGVATRAGEYAAGELERAVDRDDITGRAVEEMVRLFASRQKWLVFCAGVEHAQHVASALVASGIPAAPVHGELSAYDRATRLEDFKSGALRAITSMDVLTTGYDEPAIDAIALLRPTKSTGLYVQMVGRGFRLHPSKLNTLVLDFAGNVARHGPVDAIKVRDVAPGGGGEAPTKTCENPECLTIVFAGVRVCPQCGFEFPAPAPLPILPESSLLPILKSEPPPITWEDVGEVEYHFHQRDDRTPSMRVEYFSEGGFAPFASEWICFEHEGYARRKAEAWWAQRSGDPPPSTIAEAIARKGELLEPTAIALQPDGRYTRVVDARLPAFAAAAATRAVALPPAATLPRACWSCSYWSDVAAPGTCRRWDATPPAEVQAAGCETWVEDDLPF